jgi:hypothetical protein
MTLAAAQRISLGTGAVIVTVLGGNLTVTETGVAIAGSGNTLLSASSGLTFNAPVASTGGNISLIAGTDITQTASGDITTSGAGSTVDMKADGAIAMSTAP